VRPGRIEVRENGGMIATVERGTLATDVSRAVLAMAHLL
jgi:hypothetical protein